MNEMEDVPPAKRMKVGNQSNERSNENKEQNINHGEPDTMTQIAVNPVIKSERNDNAKSNETQNENGTLEKNESIQNKETSDLTDEASQASTSQYNYVTPEELQKLREFQVLDEVNDEDSKDEESDSSGRSEKSDDLPDEEIEKMLEEDLPEGFKGVPKPKEKAYITRQKIVLEEKGINHFEVLPLDWMMVRHCSGMPVYMHRSTRVCTLSKPYFLGKGNTRRHDIPISAIPCLAYRKALEEEEKQKEIDKSIAEQIQNGTWANNEPKTMQGQQTGSQTNNSNQPEVQDTSSSSSPCPPNFYVTNGDFAPVVDTPPESQHSNDDTSNSAEVEDQVPESNNEATQNSEKPVCPFNKDVLARKPVVLPGGIVMPPPRVETVNTSWKTQHLPATQVNDYCKKLFKFKTVNIMHFKRWADRRKYVKVRKTLQYPTLPQGTKLITIPAQNNNGQENGGKATKRDWVMNMNGCSYLSVFHEYVRRALQKQPVYEFKQLENASTPYQATVYIGGMQYGVGHGSSKRQAKSAAARASIHILIPEMKDELDEHTSQNPADNNSEPDSFFDYVGIEDPRIQEFCAATSEPSPHAILRTCLLRNFGAGDRHIHTEMKKLEYQKIELTMKVGKHTATVVCKNKKQAKQRASQSILQQLHPHIRSWGSLLRLYGSRSVKSCKEKKLEEQQITLLQDKAQQNEPNYAVLEKLRNEMRKLKERDEAVVPIGTLLVAEDLPTHSGSMLNNVDL